MAILPSMLLKGIWVTGARQFTIRVRAGLYTTCHDVFLTGLKLRRLTAAGQVMEKTKDTSSCTDSTAKYVDSSTY
jgi:hypothetical protein